MRAGPLRGWRFLSQPARRGPACHAHTRGRRGSTCIRGAGLVDLGHRPAPGPGPQDRPGLSERGHGPGRPPDRRSDPLGVQEYVAARFADDPHVWASALYDEVVPLGYPLSYPSFVRQLRTRWAAPALRGVHGVKGRDTIEIDHPARRRDPVGLVRAAQRSVGGTAYVLLGTLPHSGRVRGVLAEKMDQAHLVEAMDEVMRRLGGTARVWRTDRLATVIAPGTSGRPGHLRSGGQALRGRRRALSAAAREPQRVRSSPRCGSARDGGGAR